MSSIASIALSGMQAAQLTLDTSANNVANSSTPGYQHEQVAQTSQPGGGVAATVLSTGVQGDTMAADLVTQLQAKTDFLANLSVFKASDKMAGKLIDTLA